LLPSITSSTEDLSGALRSLSRVQFSDWDFAAPTDDNREIPLFEDFEYQEGFVGRNTALPLVNFTPSHNELGPGPSTLVQSSFNAEICSLFNEPSLSDPLASTGRLPFEEFKAVDDMLSQFGVFNNADANTCIPLLNIPGGHSAPSVASTIQTTPVDDEWKPVFDLQQSPIPDLTFSSTSP
jgi:hypothetical protein